MISSICSGFALFLFKGLLFKEFRKWQLENQRVRFSIGSLHDKGRRSDGCVASKILSYCYC